MVQKRGLGSHNLVTIPVSRLARTQGNLELGIQLVHLWEQETGLGWTKTVNELENGLNQTDLISYSEAEVDVDSGMLKANAENIYPKSFFTGNGLELVRRGWKKEKMAPYKKPPQPADETWLLSKCLHDHWPSGGTLFIGDPAKWPERQDNIWVHLRRQVTTNLSPSTPLLFQLHKTDSWVTRTIFRFLRQPRWRHHPRIALLQAWAQDLSSTAKFCHMIRNLRLLRGVLRQRKIQTRNYFRKKREVKDVRLAGTEVIIKPPKFDEKGELQVNFEW